MAQLPPMDPHTDEATAEQLEYAREQGDAYQSALELMVNKIAQTGGEVHTGDYLIGFAVEEAEGLYTLDDDGLQWHAPQDENAHIEVAVRDAADGRFIPGLDIRVTVIDADGKDLGTYPHQLVWHPMIYHYARNWALPGDGTYTIRVEFPPPTFMRHDRTNGRRFLEPGSAEFTGVQIATGQD
jgi:hypothetical protein